MKKFIRLFCGASLPYSMIHTDFGDSFHWGVATSAFQTEGAYQEDGKGLSIWDVFTQHSGKIYRNQHAREACDFYHRYAEDLQLLRLLHIDNFRFSLSWPRILPNGTGSVNQLGIDFYNRVIDTCLSLGITPWVTLYHWDLPQALHERGGWTNRDVVGWFKEYVAVAVRAFGDRVRHWMVLNEPMMFTGGGYFLGIHAPGKRSVSGFLSAVHHATLCQAEGGRVIKDLQPTAEVGTTFSCAHIEASGSEMRHQKAAQRADALLNRLFIEPSLGMGYPVDQLSTLARLEKYVRAGDEQLMLFDFDFIGLQNYTREVIRHAWTMPYVFARPVDAKKRGVPTTLMGWEVYPEAIYQVLKQFYERYSLKKIVITENGAAFSDSWQNGRVTDPRRTDYIRENIAQCARAKREGIPLAGYFVWTLTDNFEWAEGYRTPFGLVHVNFETQRRTIKDSGHWYGSFVRQQKALPSGSSKR